MNQIARCDWLPERARWSYLARSGLPTLSLEKKFPRKPSFFSLVGWVLASSINTHKNELGQYPAILTSHLVNNPYILPARVANHWAEFDLSCPLIKNELYNLHLHPITSWCTYCWVYYTCHCPLMQMSYKAGSKFPAHVPFGYLFLNSSGEVRSVGGKHLMGFKSNTSVFKLLWLQSMNRA